MHDARRCKRTPRGVAPPPVFDGSRKGTTLRFTPHGGHSRVVHGWGTPHCGADNVVAPAQWTSLFLGLAGVCGMEWDLVATLLAAIVPARGLQRHGNRHCVCA